MTPFWGEFIGTGLLLFIGQTVVSNVVLEKSKGQNSGWIVISFGWAMAVFIGVYCSAASSKAHLNPAVTIAFAALGKFPWASVPMYIAAQMLGAMAGSLVAWLCFRLHFRSDGRCECQAGRFLHCAGYTKLWKQSFDGDDCDLCADPRDLFYCFAVE
ncbi:MIP/aquaporin family protein [Puia sp. P3]|uniref:MIP/aquaporin family protein n=1 Tax=Puia sp. P3 TaxID=3423952 RepID=UPI003D66F04E